MSKRRKVNLPLLEVIGVSLIVHLIVIIGLGGYTIYHALIPDEPELEAPPPPQRVETQKLQQQVRIQQQQRRSSRPVQKISVTNVSSVNLPDLSVNMPTVETKVAVGGSYGSSRLNDNFGGGGIDFSKSAVDFFGIKSTGEKVMFIVDASSYMLVDEKGGIPAYDIIKEEISNMVDKLSSGTLFNVMFYSGGSLQAYSTQMLPATRQNKELFKEWIKPINKDYENRGKLKSNMSVKNREIEPLKKDASNWVKAVQVAMEQGADSINLIVAAWQWQGRSLTSAEREKLYKEKGWDDEKKKAWEAASKKATEWLKKENERRRKAGQPERVVTWIGVIVRELGIKVEYPPSPGSWSNEEVNTFVKNVERHYYREKDRDEPPVNVVLFLGADENEEKNSSVRLYEEFVRDHHGKFRILKGLKALKNIGR